MHDDVLDVKTGQIVRQGEKIGDEGGFGGGRPNRFGAHLHIEASRGRNIAYQVQNGAGTYCTPNQVNIWDALWVGGDVQILKDGGYSWKRDVKKEENDMEFLEVTSERCEVFTEANVNAPPSTTVKGVRSTVWCLITASILSLGVIVSMDSSSHNCFVLHNILGLLCVSCLYYTIVSIRSIVL